MQFDKVVEAAKGDGASYRVFSNSQSQITQLEQRVARLEEIGTFEIQTSWPKSWAKKTKFDFKKNLIFNLSKPSAVRPPSTWRYIVRCGAKFGPKKRFA